MCPFMSIIHIVVIVLAVREVMVPWIHGFTVMYSNGT